MQEEGTTIRLRVEIASDHARASRAVADGDDASLLAAVRGRFLEALETEDDAGGSWLAAERMRWDRQLREAGVREGRKLLGSGRAEEALAHAELALASGADHLASWALYLDALAATEVVTRIEDGLARLEAAAEHGILGTTESQGWRALARRIRRGMESGAAAAAAATSLPGTLPFTGRGALLAHLQRLLRLPPGETRRIIAVIASAGFGKSRLLRELRLRYAGVSGVMVCVEARGGESTTPYSLLNRVVEALADLPDARGIDPEMAAVLVAANPRLTERFGDRPRAVAAMPSRSAIAEALRELVNAVSEHQPLQLVVDDTQWGDEASLTLLDGAFSGHGTGEAVWLFATRDLATAMPPHWHTLHLSSLTVEEIAELLSSELPALPMVRQIEAAAALLLVTGGVPFYVMRALQRLNELASGGTAGEALLARIPTLVLHRDPAFPAGEVDRRLLGYLAIAGGSVGEEELGGLADSGSSSAIRDRLALLERSGWVVRHASGYQLSHDLVQQQAIEGLSPAERRSLALQHARWLGQHGQALHDLQRAVRVSLAHGADAEAVRAVRQWQRRVRSGPRGRALASIVLPPETPRSLWWRVVGAATPAPLRMVTAAAMVLGIGGWALVGWLGRPATLRLENTPRVPGINAVNMGRVRSNFESPIFTVRDRLGRLTGALDGMPLAISGWSGAVDSARLDQPNLVQQGQVAATALQVYGPLQDSLIVSFRVGGIAPLPVTVFRGFGIQALAIEGGVINGSPVAAERPEIVVGPGDSLVGFVRLRYTTPSQAALWILAASSTMRPAIEDTMTVITLHTGARDAITEPFVQRQAPMTPGGYWLIWAFAAEKDAVSILSLTNWRCGAPHWNDGNDLATVPDSALQTVWGGGALTVLRDLCDVGEAPRRERTIFPAAAVRVVVRGGVGH